MAAEETPTPVNPPAGGGDAPRGSAQGAAPEQVEQTEQAAKSERPAKAEKAPKAAKPAKAAKPTKARGGKGAAGKAAAAAGSGPRAGGRGSKLFLAEHPRAVRGVARAKAWGGLAGFLVAGYLSLPTHTLPEAGLEALAAGIACYVVAWAGALFLWRRLVVAELRQAQHTALTAELARMNRANPTASLGRGPGTPAGPERGRARAGV